MNRRQVLAALLAGGSVAAIGGLRASARQPVLPSPPRVEWYATPSGLVVVNIGLGDGPQGVTWDLCTYEGEIDTFEGDFS